MSITYSNNAKLLSAKLDALSSSSFTPSSSSGSKAKAIALLLSRLDNKIVPQEYKQALEEEIQKINSIESGEDMTTSKNYIEFLTSLPFNVQCKEETDISKAEKCIE